MRFPRAAPPNVRISLACLILGCVLPLAFVAGLLIFDFYQRGQAQLTSNAISRARAIISTVDRDFASTEAALQALGTSHRLATGDLAGFHGRAQQALHSMRADSIVVLDPSGQLLLSTRRPFGAPLPKLTHAPLLQRVLATGRPAVSDLYPGPVVQRLIYTVAVPVRHAGAIALLLCATAAPAQLGSILSEQKLPGSWRSTIVDSAGNVVARSHDIGKYVGQSVHADLLQNMRTSNEGGFETQTLDGIPVITVFSRSSLTGWAVVLGMPLAELTAPVRQTLIWLILATLTALAAGLGLAWLIGGRIAGSVSALTGPALAVGGGGPMPLLPRLHFKEANELGRALQDASGKLERTRADLRESEQRFTLAVQATHLGIWTRDLVHGELWCSDQWRALFGFVGPEPVTLEQMLQRIHGDDRAALRQLLAAGASAYDIEYRIDLPGTPLRWIAAQGGVEHDAAGRALVARGVVCDITARKQAELELNQKQKELLHLSRVSMLGELSGALAHELNQPLTAILGNGQAAQRFLARPAVDLDEIRAIVQDIVDEARRAGEVIRRLRQLLRYGELQRQSVDLNLLLQETERLLHGDLLLHGVALRTLCAADLARVTADPVQLQQVLINLIMNACDAMAAMPAGERTILVQAARCDGAVAQVCVADQGPGIAADRRDTIFEPFYTTKEHGTGLGLSICRTIVEANGGRLWCENNLGRGASFRFSVPLDGAAQP